MESVLRRMIITIDGPAGSGKSTTAATLAKRLGLTYLDTGAMYRAATLAVLRSGIDAKDEEAVCEVVRNSEISFEKKGSTVRIHLNGEDVEKEIRGKEVSELVSPVSKYAGVRKVLVRIQRQIGANGGIVAEGRDTGSVVFPYADVKVFLIADVKTRALRRLKQLESMGVKADIDEIIDNIKKRDEIDSSREHSPLVRPPGAFDVDTSSITIDQQVSLIEEIVMRRASKLEELSVKRGDKDPFASMSFYYRVSHWLVRTFFKVVFGLKIYGEENLKFRENFIFASNHLSYADPPIVGSTLNREVTFLAKKELFENPIFAWLIRKYHAIPVDREEVDKTTMKLILQKLKSGESILMFPEGTRSRDGKLGQFKGGLGFIALNTRRTIIPIYISGSNRLKECFLRKEKLIVRIGPPMRIPPEYVTSNKKQDYLLISKMVENELRMLKDETEI